VLLVQLVRLAEWAQLVLPDLPAFQDYKALQVQLEQLAQPGLLVPPVLLERLALRARLGQRVLQV
jgi:hypothetical protein